MKTAHLCNVVPEFNLVFRMRLYHFSVILWIVVMKIPFFSSRKNTAAVTMQSPVHDDKIKNPVDLIIHYHEETKHNYHRFSRSLGYLDWDTQPDPFRRFHGSPLHRLPLLPQAAAPFYDECFISGKVPATETSLISISRLFKSSLAISAWKRYQEARWALRVNPSSGNLHPTEGYLILGNQIPELNPGLYHYTPEEHGLELRASFSSEVFNELSSSFPMGTFFTGLSSIHWREAWKYGERAFRYCQHDLGHALAAFRISAAVLGWRMVLLDQLSNDQIANLLGLSRAEDFGEAEDEHPASIAAIIPSTAAFSSGAISNDAIIRLSEAEWYGHANRLSVTHVEWDIIDAAAEQSWKPRTEHGVLPGISAVGTSRTNRQLSAEQIIQQRRSCLALDGVTTIDVQSFYQMMSSVVPLINPTPFDMLEASVMASPRVHLGLFVHRVVGLEPGLYLLVRDPEIIETLKSAMHPDFLWSRPPACPESLSLFLLKQDEVSRIATSVSCGQDIAGDGAFSLGMIAEFEEPLREVGAWLYPRLFWETGIIGQILYLEAEAAGIRSTGIGCFFDDPVHETFGLRNRKFQSLYHFTMGGPVEDTRLTTEPAYVRE